MNNYYAEYNIFNMMLLHFTSRYFPDDPDTVSAIRDTFAHLWGLVSNDEETLIILNVIIILVNCFLKNHSKILGRYSVAQQICSETAVRRRLWQLF